MASTAPKRAWQAPAIVAVLALIALYFAWNALYYFPYIVDDAFISLRYAENLLQGEGLVYNSGQPIEGYSNFSWVMLQALFLAADWPVIDALKYLSLLLGLVTLGLTLGLGRRLWPRGEPFANLKAVLAVSLLGLNTSLAVWSQAGLETVLLAALMTAMVWRYEVELTHPRAWPVSAILFGLAWLTRPEVPIYALYFVVRRLTVRRERRLDPADLKWLAALAAIVVPYEVWGRLYFGSWLPATHAAKLGTGWDGLVQGLQGWAHQPALSGFLTGQGWGFAVLLLLAAIASVFGRRSPVAAWTICLSGLIFVLYAHHDWMPRHRFFVPFLPFVCLWVADGVGEFLRWSRSRRWLLVACALLCVVAVTDYARVQCFGGKEKHTNLARQDRGFWFSEVPDQFRKRIYPVQGPAMYILKHLPPGEWICLRDIGFPGYLSGNPIWDMVGLVTPTAAKARTDHDDAAMFHELLRLRPGCFWLLIKDRNPKSLAPRIDEWLRTDPVAGALWERTRENKVRGGRLTVYLRRDLPVMDREVRFAEAADRFPEYRPRLERELKGRASHPAAQ